MNRNRNIQGFGLVAVLVVIVCLGVAGFAGWYVTRKHSSNSSVNKRSDTQAESRDVKAAGALPSKNETDNEYKTYDNNDPRYTVNYPNDWSVVADENKPAGYAESRHFTSPDYSKEADTRDAIGRVTAGGSFSVAIHDSPTIKDTADYKTQMNGPGSYRPEMKDITISGYPAVLDERCGHPVVMATCAYMAVDNTGYDLMYTFSQGEDPANAKYRREFDKFVESFKLNSEQD